MKTPLRRLFAAFLCLSLTLPSPAHACPELSRRTLRAGLEGAVESELSAGLEEPTTERLIQGAERTAGRLVMALSKQQDFFEIQDPENNRIYISYRLAARLFKNNPSHRAFITRKPRSGPHPMVLAINDRLETLFASSEKSISDPALRTAVSRLKKLGISGVGIQSKTGLFKFWTKARVDKVIQRSQKVRNPLSLQPDQITSVKQRKSLAGKRLFGAYHKVTHGEVAEYSSWPEALEANGFDAQEIYQTPLDQLRAGGRQEEISFYVNPQFDEQGRLIPGQEPLLKKRLFSLSSVVEELVRLSSVPVETIGLVGIQAHRRKILTDGIAAFILNRQNYSAYLPKSITADEVPLLILLRMDDPYLRPQQARVLKSGAQVYPSPSQQRIFLNAQLNDSGELVGNPPLYVAAKSIGTALREDPDFKKASAVVITGVSTSDIGGTARFRNPFAENGDSEQLLTTARYEPDSPLRLNLQVTGTARKNVAAAFDPDLRERVFPRLNGFDFRKQRNGRAPVSELSGLTSNMNPDDQAALVDRRLRRNRVSYSATVEFLRSYHDETLPDDGGVSFERYLDGAQNVFQGDALVLFSTVLATLRQAKKLKLEPKEFPGFFQFQARSFNGSQIVETSAGLEETGPIRILYKNLKASFEEVLAFSRRHKVRSYKLYRDKNEQDPIVSRIGHPNNPPPPWDATDLLEKDLLFVLGARARDTRYYIQITEEPKLVGKIWAEVVPVESAAGLEETLENRFRRSAEIFKQRGWFLSADSFTDAFLKTEDFLRQDLAIFEQRALKAGGADRLRRKWRKAIENKNRFLPAFSALMEHLSEPASENHALTVVDWKSSKNGYRATLEYRFEDQPLRAVLAVNGNPESPMLRISLNRKVSGSNPLLPIGQVRIGKDRDPADLRPRPPLHLDILIKPERRSWLPHEDLMPVWSKGPREDPARALERFQDFLESLESHLTDLRGGLEEPVRFTDRTMSQVATLLEDHPQALLAVSLPPRNRNDRREVFRETASSSAEAAARFLNKIPRALREQAERFSYDVEILSPADDNRPAQIRVTAYRLFPSGEPTQIFRGLTGSQLFPILSEFRPYPIRVIRPADARASAEQRILEIPAEENPGRAVKAVVQQLLSDKELVPEDDQVRYTLLVFENPTGEEGLAVAAEIRIRAPEFPLVSAFAGLEEGPEPLLEQEFIQTIQQRVDPHFQEMLDVLGEKLEDLVRSPGDWDSFLRDLPAIANWLDQDSGFPNLARLSEQIDPARANNAPWKKFREFYIYYLREALLTIAGQGFSGKNDSPSGFQERVAAARFYLTTVLPAIHQQLMAATTELPPFETILDNSEWSRLMDLSEIRWNFFYPKGKVPFPSMLETGQGAFQASPLLSAAEQMKRANVNAESFVYDFGSGLGDPSILAAVLFGASSLGVEQSSGLVRLAELWKAEVVKKYPAVATNVAFRNGDALNRNLDRVTHLYWFGPDHSPLLGQFNALIPQKLRPGTKLAFPFNDADKKLPTLFDPKQFQELHRDTRIGSELILEKLNPAAGLEEMAKSVNLLLQVPPAVPGSVGEAALVFTDPATFDLAALAVRWGWSVAVLDDSPEADALKELLDALPGPKGRYAVGPLESSLFLEGYPSQILIEDRPKGFRILGLLGDDLPPPVAGALESVLVYLNRARQA